MEEKEQDKEAKWYVVHTYSGYENKVKTDIEKTVENRKLQDQILEVAVPMQDTVEMKNGAKKQVERKLFPGYVLIHMFMNDDTWYVVRNTRGVTGFVGPGSRASMSTSRVLRLLLICLAGRPLLKLALQKLKRLNINQSEFIKFRRCQSWRRK